MTSLAEKADEYLAAHEYDSTAKVEQAHVELSTMMIRSPSTQVAVIDKFPKSLSKKNMHRIEQALPAGVEVRVLHHGEICFVDTNNGNKTTWLPPAWSQEKIQTFLSVTLKMDISKLTVLHHANSLHRGSTCSSQLENSVAISEQATLEPPPEQQWYETDEFRRVLSFIKLLIRCFNVVMASLLVVFVPQLCPGDPTNADIVMRTPHDCTLNENFTDLITINKWALTFNFVSLFFYLLMFTIEYYREAFLLLFLEVDQNKAMDYLPIELKEHSKIRMILRRWNVMLFLCSITAILTTVINIILSSIVIYKYYYVGPRSVTVLVTNVLLMVTLVVDASNNSWVGLQTDEALSCTDVVPYSFNAVEDGIEALEAELQPEDFDILGILPAVIDAVAPIRD
jgi:hypothetical protein